LDKKQIETMTSLHIRVEDIPSLEGETAIVTGQSCRLEYRKIAYLLLGGASGIGFATAKILSSKGAKAYILDINSPDEALPPNAEFIKCNITSWSELRSAFEHVKKVDIAVANAGVSEECSYFEDTFDESGQLLEPKYGVLEVNYRAVLNFVKLSTSYMRRAGGGSMVITSSATAYAPEQSLPVYSSSKLAVSLGSSSQSVLSI
jgi:NAD(P)-dependent dehydrogenase (short-subunit alcohol dehydrogenase family)